MLRATVPERVLDLFAVPGDVQALPGGQGGSVVAGDLVLSPERDSAVAAWLSPVLARLAVGLDERPAPPGVRLAVPVPARDGSWVVDGWAASRWEPGSRACDDLELLVATGRLLHAELAVAVRRRPGGLDDRTDRWAVAERLAFGAPEQAVAAADGDVPGLAGLVAELTAVGDTSTTSSGPPAQLVHADLAGNVLLDARGVPVVVDLAPAWRPRCGRRRCAWSTPWRGATPPCRPSYVRPRRTWRGPRSSGCCRTPPPTWRATGRRWDASTSRSPPGSGGSARQSRRSC